MNAKMETDLERFQQQSINMESMGIRLDYSRMGIEDHYIRAFRGHIIASLEQQKELEGGAIANPDEGRMVGHYWLRNPDLAPNAEIKNEIKNNITEIRKFVERIHSGETVGQKGEFNNFLLVGIGGSALGPQFVASALTQGKADELAPYFFDNTDPDGMDLVLEQLEGELGKTLIIVISKSGGTKETRNGMLEAKNAYEKAGLDFSKHAVAVTGEGSKLDRIATSEGWLAKFPLWDWVGGRTSELSAVGLLPAALQGIDINNMLLGAAEMDILTREEEYLKNPAVMLALSWHKATDGRGEKDMVILPYKDRLGLLSSYLQQLVMESLGKDKDLNGNTVHQGIAVYGNKGSTDQHAYVQQLRDGVDNFFVTFIEVLKDRNGDSIEVEKGITSGDYLHAFMLGTREALTEKGRQSITITIPEVSAYNVGALIALFERTVGVYANLVGINAYHQPGVEAGKKAAAEILELKLSIVELLKANQEKKYSAEKIAKELGKRDKLSIIESLMRHLKANGKV